MGRKKEQGIPDQEMRRTADDLIEVAIQAFMKIHGVDRKAAERWIASAAAAGAKRKLARLGKSANAGR